MKQSQLIKILFPCRFRFYGNDKRMLFKEANISNLTMRSRSDDSVASEEVFRDALPHLGSIPGEPAGASFAAAILAKEPAYECGICLTSEQLTSDKSFSLKCGHKYCEDCWREYLTHSILKEGKVNVT